MANPIFPTKFIKSRWWTIPRPLSSSPSINNLSPAFILNTILASFGITIWPLSPTTTDPKKNFPLGGTPIPVSSSEWLTKSSNLTLYKFASFIQLSISGLDSPFSHFATDYLETLIFSAISSCVYWFFFLRLFKFLLIILFIPPIFILLKLLITFYQLTLTFIYIFIYIYLLINNFIFTYPFRVSTAMFYIAKFLIL